MKTIISTLLLTFFVCGNVFPQRAESGLRKITPGLLKRHIDYLASDSMKGRNTPGPELDLAAGYIAGEFARLGIQPVGDSYFQNIPLSSKSLVKENCLFTISRDKQTKTFSLKTDYVPFEMNNDNHVQSGIVFAGYGITAPEFNYDDYAGLDVSGKMVLVMKHEPGEKDSLSVFKGVKETRHSLLKTKTDNARAHGATGLLLVTDPLNHLLLNPQGFPWPGLSAFLPRDILPVEMDNEKESFPAWQVGESVIRFLFGSVDSLKKIQKKIDTNLKPCSYPIENTACNLQTGIKKISYSAKNVIGLIKGKGTKEEYVVIGGHYDHVGMLKNHKEGEDYIFNGADDNASGTAGVLAIAEAFSSMRKKTDRNILFVLFAGEEKGLYGSEYYCNNPLVPLDKSVVMLNLDMISRNGADSISIDGLQYNPDLAKILLKEAQKLKLRNFKEKEDLFSRSDHYNFFKKGISGVDITSGLHKDYHKVSDDPASVDPVKAATISALTFKTALTIANSRNHYKTITPAR